MAASRSSPTSASSRFAISTRASPSPSTFDPKRFLLRFSALLQHESSSSCGNFLLLVKFASVPHVAVIVVVVVAQCASPSAGHVRCVVFVAVSTLHPLHRRRHTSPEERKSRQDKPFNGVVRVPKKEVLGGLEVGVLGVGKGNVERFVSLHDSLALSPPSPAPTGLLLQCIDNIAISDVREMRSNYPTTVSSLVQQWKQREGKWQTQGFRGLQWEGVS
ncbi:hypothetical protein ZHAS_00022285 [Anopheles sinensis]|uniref:Uncharacterized protein n=1 Tax=Anopheles sinensis TaxID=74873 RepID=A0A084WUF2_ANOSI|nr:hypothetical protein ZHAS_00022285 [Anopheles sinensis]